MEILYGYHDTAFALSYSIGGFYAEVPVIEEPTADMIGYICINKGNIHLDYEETWGFDGYYEVPLPEDYEGEADYSYGVDFESAVEEAFAVNTPIRVEVTWAGGWSDVSMEYVDAINAYVDEGMFFFTITINEDYTITVSDFPEMEEIVEWYKNWMDSNS